MRINLKNLKTFSRCPVAFCFNIKEKTVITTENKHIISNVITKAILQVMETSFRADWKKIINWVDKEIFKNVDIYDLDQYNAAKKNSEYILLALGVWYERVYLQWSSEAFVNVPLGVETSGIFIESQAPVINLMNPIVCTYIGDDLYLTKKEYYNDIEIRGLAWLVSEHLKCDEVTIQCLSLGKRGRLETNVVSFDSNSLKKTFIYINNMCRIIKHKYIYPSISEGCISCKYYSKCNP